MAGRPRVDGATATTLAREFGLVFPGAQAAFRDAALARAAAALDEPDVARVVARAAGGDGAARDALARVLTVGESYFFRDPAHFALLTTEVIPRLARRAGPVRLWSAGCAAGEEAYSLAIATIEAVGDPSRVEVVATDLNDEFLARADAGVYRAWSFRGTDPSAWPRWLVRDGDGWRISQALRRRVKLARLNLVAADAQERASRVVGPVGVVFCRNVLLYFDPPAVEATARLLASCLEEDGWVFPGASDPPFPESAGFRAQFIGGVRVYRRASSTPHSTRARAEVLGTASPPAPPARHVPAPSSPAVVSPGPPIEEAEARARALADAGQVDEAAALVDSLLARDAFHAPLHVLRATLDLARGEYEQAARDAGRASLLDRALAMPHLLAASAWIALGELDAADRALRQAVARLDPSGGTVPCSGGLSPMAVLDVCRTLAAELARKRERSNE